MQSPPATTKYKIAYEALLSRLKAGRYAVGGRLPTEEELTRAFDVSRVTIRRSLDILVNEGYLERRQGSGYTVLTLSPPSTTCLSSFTDAMLRAGCEPASRLISITKHKAGATPPGDLPEELRSKALTCLERLRLVDEVPKMFVRTWAPTAYLRDAKPADFPERGPEQSILRILGDRFGLSWGAACEDISPLAADGAVADHLDTAPGTPILLQACTAFDDSHRIVFFEQVFRMGKVSFDLVGRSREPRLQ